MTLRTRNAACQALFALGAAAYAWANTPARTQKFVLWNDVPQEQRPAFYQFEGGDEDYVWTASPYPKRVIPVRWFVYLNASNAAQGPTANDILDAFDAKLATGVPPLGKQTLGGTCEFCRIVGPVLKEPGDLDGDGILMIPLHITLP